MRIFEYIESQAKELPIDKSISYKENGEWKSYSSQDVLNHVQQYSRAFLDAKISKGDTIAIIANNRPEWNFCDLGMMRIGAVNIPIYPTSSLNDYLYILNNAEVKMIFISDQTIFDKLVQIKDSIPSLKAIYSFDSVENCAHVSEFLSKADSIYDSEIESIKSSISEENLATIIYTSGTTGNPKGVMLSHKNIDFNVTTAKALIPLEAGAVVLSFLPLCHIFERVATYFYISKSISIYYAESIDTLKANISEVKPHFFTCVPRLLEKIHEGMIAKAQELSGIKKMLYLWAVKLAHKPDAKSRLGYSFLDKMIFSKWREALGGNIVGIVTGAAALQPKLNVFFNNAGIRIREAYGMTETAPCISSNRFSEGENIPGTVGLVFDGVEVKLLHREGMDEQDGEILIKGDNVMMGYYKNEEATNQAIIDGWFYTGDVGRYVNKNFLKITDRVKELFKTSGGKYVAPQYLENKLKENKYIEQIIVIGNGRKFVSALIYPSIHNLKIWAGYKNLKLDWESNEWTTNKLVNLKLKKEIEHYNEQFSQIEKVKKFTLLNSEWTIDGGELTPTLKLKRKVIESKLLNTIEAMYID